MTLINKEYTKEDVHSMTLINKEYTKEDVHSMTLINKKITFLVFTSSSVFSLNESSWSCTVSLKSGPTGSGSADATVIS